MSTDFAEKLGLSHPIIQAPLAGGGDTPALTAAVSEAGGLGFIGAAYLGADAMSDAATAVRQATNRPFGINLFAPTAISKATDSRTAVARVAPYYAELGLPAPRPPDPPAERFDAQMAAVLESGATVFSFTFGMLPADAMTALKSRGLFVIGTATVVEEALALEGAGVDAVTVQGAEAGGHRGTFAAPFEAAMVGTMALVPQVVDAVKVPVIASGGIMDGRGIAAALALGASAVQMGTAFLTCDEAGVPAAYKQAILAARPERTRLTRAFSGRPARGIVNRFMTEVEGERLAPDVADTVLPFPLQNALTRPLRTEAAKQDRAAFLSLWAGQGAPLARRQPAAKLVERLAVETDAAIGGLGN